jgi:hypothetical protein
MKPQKYANFDWFCRFTTILFCPRQLYLAGSTYQLKQSVATYFPKSRKAYAMMFRSFHIL